MSRYATQQHVLQGELLLLNLNCCLLAEQRMNLWAGKGWKGIPRRCPSHQKLRGPATAARAGPGCFRRFCGWLHQPCSPKHLPTYELLPRESSTFNLASRCSSLSSWTVTLCKTSSGRLRQRFVRPQRAKSLCHCSVTDMKHLQVVASHK